MYFIKRDEFSVGFAIILPVSLSLDPEINKEDPQDEFNKQRIIAAKSPMGWSKAGCTPIGFVTTLPASGFSDWHFISNIGMPWCEPPARMGRLHLTQSLPIMLQFLYRNHVMPHTTPLHPLFGDDSTVKKYWNVDAVLANQRTCSYLSSRLLHSSSVPFVAVVQRCWLLVLCFVVLFV